MEAPFRAKHRRQRSIWTAQEDELLAKAVLKYHESNWKAIAKEVGTRDYVQCLHRWKMVLRPNLKKGRWSLSEDALLVALTTHCTPNWVGVSKNIYGRSSKQVMRKRVCVHLFIFNSLTSYPFVIL